ncbi:hypothetical protein FJQ98_10495 [Lysinibacillus agricola]|uniref:Thiopeptide-type bacteriocin biosynthesis domain-containing protein n=1 Tax=Lysinibacillus agricola TaxID=2590012 RepID=A0ABX7AWR8_9BACI|nr:MULTISPECIES: lantibiotic dehydratase C-terminal domain-containing protein [Lysinibacillus]KOS64280.1 hypothetical protein AN161_03635 [Lysinibacillus sp. FJAT-14222]QQP14400.1 hypothetical protein FJQ98_10495 [Lysinibacillus agricola]
MWQTISIYYYEHNKDALLLKMNELISTLNEKYTFKFYFRRHWKFGSHIRMNISANETDYEQIRTYLIDNLQTYLKEHPSTEILNKKELLRVHKQLGKLEGESGPFSPFMDNNTIHDTKYDDRSNHFDELDHDTMAEIMTKLSPFILQVIKSTNENTKLRSIVSILLMLNFANFEQNREVSSLSYRSHTEGFFNMISNPAQTKEDFEKIYLDLSEDISDYSEALFMNNIGVLPEFLQQILFDWNQVINNMYLIVAANIKRTSVKAKAIQGSHAKVSDFHNHIYSSNDIRKYLDSKQFRIVRILINFMYITLSQLGFSPKYRFFLCWVCANEIESYFGTS